MVQDVALVQLADSYTATLEVDVLARLRGLRQLLLRGSRVNDGKASIRRIQGRRLNLLLPEAPPR